MARHAPRASSPMARHALRTSSRALKIETFDVTLMLLPPLEMLLRLLMLLLMLLFFFRLAILSYVMTPMRSLSH